MLTFFDFLYYKIYKAYSKTSESSPEFAGSCAVSGFQTFNISSVIWLYGYFFNRGELYMSELFGGILIVSLIILNYIRYIRINKFSKEVIEAKWESKSPDDQKNTDRY
jgi:hypothetical protein